MAMALAVSALSSTCMTLLVLTNHLMPPLPSVYHTLLLQSHVQWPWQWIVSAWGPALLGQ